MIERSLAQFARLDVDNDGRVTAQEREAARGPGAPGGPAPDGARGGGGPGGRLARADADGDGVITREEVEVQTRERFARQDANGDGVVTADEMQAAFGGRGSGRPGRPPPGGML